ncbi:MAG: thiamine pyrophosphate-binding protein [Acetobacterales bacterium]
MADPQLSNVLAQAFVAEGVDTLFTLMGDANMYWSVEMAQQPGMRVIHARHEHCACTMADAWSRYTGRVGVASVTCGPGYTQIMTALAIASRAGSPMVVFAGDAPQGAAWYLQDIDQAPLAHATGAHHIAIRSVDRALDCVREAFVIAQVERRPVVLGVPLDLQREAFPYPPDYMPSKTAVPVPQRPQPDPELVDRVVDMIAEAKRPILIGGRGALRSGAGKALEAVAERAGALLATSLLAKGLFEGNPYNLDIAGAFASDLSREYFAESDLVIGVGAGLGHYTTEGGYLYPEAKVVQVDTNPRGIWQGLRTADLHVRADAKAAAEALVARLDARGVARQGYRSGEIADAIAADSPDSKQFQVQPGTLDPRETMRELDAVIPKDWDIVVGGGHYFSFVMTHMRGRAAERFHVVNDFGAIGSGFSAAIAVALARGDGKVVLFEGDGSMLMHIQEMETMRRHGVRLLTCVMNDGGYGAEFHKFRAKGVEDKEAIHGRGDLAAVARGFGLRGEQVTQKGRFDALLREHNAAEGSTLLDIHIDDRIPSRAYRRVHFGEI